MRIHITIQYVLSFSRICCLIRIFENSLFACSVVEGSSAGFQLTSKDGSQQGGVPDHYLKNQG